MKKPANYIPHAKHLLLIILFLAAFLERTIFDLGANIELVTTALILTSLYVGKKEAFWLMLAIMAVTDRIIGNTSILIFTWSGFLVPALLVGGVLRKMKIKGMRKYFVGASAGLGTNVFFFLWTNFGVWLMDSWNMYPNTFPGLLLSYINGLPFLRNQLISSLIFIPLGIFAIEISKSFYYKFASNSLKPYRKVATS